MVKATFRMLFKNWKLFLPLFVIAVVIMAVVTMESKVVVGALGVLVGMMMWLVTIYLMRNLLARKKVKFRDGLYAGMGPLVPTFLILLLVAVECVPVMLVIIGLSAGLETEFFANFWHVAGFGIFAIAMVVLTMYLLTGTLMAMVAVSAPGMYPWPALSVAHDLMYKRRTKMVLKMLILGLVLIAVDAVILVPFLLVGLAAQGWEWNFGVAGVLNYWAAVAGCFDVIYGTIYLYLYYRELIKEDGIKESAK